MLIIIRICLFLTVFASAARAQDYTVVLDETLTSLQVVAQFDIPVKRLAARQRTASQYLASATACESDVELRVSGRSLYAPGDGLSCIRYRVDLAALAADDRRNATLADDNVLAEVGQWLWKPAGPMRHDITVAFSLPEGFDISVPWQRNDNGDYSIPPSPGSGQAVAAFGRFESAQRNIDGLQLRIAFLQSGSPYDAQASARWLESAVTHLKLAVTELPTLSLQTLLIPTGESAWSRGRPVAFGRVMRDGGRSVELFINEYAAPESFLGDWTAVHEFSHLLTPYVTTRQRWVSEGLAQYYQNLLLARAGVYSEARAWQELIEGMERGRRSVPWLSPDSASRDRPSGSRMKIYWSGAALALLADVEIRRTSGGQQSLDTALTRLVQCCVPSDRVWRAAELFETMDREIDRPVLTPLYRRYGARPGFPPFRDMLARLGVELTGSGVVFNDSAELAHIRRALTAAPPER